MGTLVRTFLLAFLLCPMLVLADGGPDPEEARGPFVSAAQRLFAEGDYNASRDIAEQLLKHFPGDAESEAILAKNKVQLHRLAKDAYENGLLMESLNRVSEAMSYWTRAANYARPGDHYHRWVEERLAHYRGMPAP